MKPIKEHDWRLSSTYTNKRICGLYVPISDRLVALKTQKLSSDLWLGAIDVNKPPEGIVRAIKDRFQQ